MMSITRRARPAFLASLLLAASLALAPVALAQDAASEPPAAEPAAPLPDAVVATVGGETITEADLAFAAEDLGQNLSSIPQAQLRAVLLAQVIDLKLMAQAGEAQGLDSDALYQMRLGYLADRALRRIYLQQAVGEAITQDEIRAEYERQVAAIPEEEEVHARHILVTTEEDAQAVKAELEAGADFAALAREKSIEPAAAQSGGDLGYFRQAVMVKPFADAAFAMEVGTVSEPVQTQFGWHVIEVLDRRAAPKPTLEQLAPQIGQQLYVQKYTELFDELRAAATIDIPDEALRGAVEAQFE